MVNEKSRVLQPLQGPHSLWDTSHRTAGGRTLLGQDLFTRRNLADRDCLISIHQLLATHRQIAASAGPTPFHVLLDRLFQQQLLERAYTFNVDGLEGRISPVVFSEDSGNAVVQVFGSNTEVRCETCRKSFPAQQFQDNFLGGIEVPCPQCNAGSEVSGARRSARTRKSRLRPAILLADEDAPTVDENAQAAAIDVLLLVGVSSKVPQMVTFMKALADSAKDQGRRVIYVGLDKLPKSTWGSYVDVCVQVNPQEWAARQAGALISQRSGLNNGAEIL
ncbi:hypothetical protein FS749_013906, partial [Ceratobasidium sp. UAMH 11750]